MTLAAAAFMSALAIDVTDVAIVTGLAAVGKFAKACLKCESISGAVVSKQGLRNSQSQALEPLAILPWQMASQAFLAVT